MNENLTSLADTRDLADELRQTRQYLHQHPELSYQEKETAAFISKRLSALGYQVTGGIGGHGLVATLRHGTGTKAMMIRADMDALPIQEANHPLPYRSAHAGVMHACGHDGHMTMLLGAACQLARRRRFSGTLHVLFQPAEETGFDSGALRMLNDGLFERFPCDVIFGAHNYPGQPVGRLLFCPGAAMSSCDGFFITLQGKGGHAARAHLAVDPIVAASSLVMALQTLVSRNTDPNETAVVSVGVFQAGQAANVIPQSARLEISVRALSESVRADLVRRVHEIAHYQAQSYGASAHIEHFPGYPVLMNHERETAFARQVAEDLLGASNVDGKAAPATGSEDFAYFLQQRPGCFLLMGNGDSASLHSPDYDFNDELLTPGAAYWTRLAESYLT